MPFIPPGQFVVLNSEREAVVEAAVDDVLTHHAGSSAGGIAAAPEQLECGIEALSPDARLRLALENDERRFTLVSLFPLCERLAVPLVYDVHHHRCNPDMLTVAEATELAESTWRGRDRIFTFRLLATAREPQTHVHTQTT